MPRHNKLGGTNCRRLIKAFRQVENVKFPGILKQLRDKYPLRRLIDETWLRVLGYKGDTTQLLDKLYGSLAEEILILKKMMVEKLEPVARAKPQTNLFIFLLSQNVHALILLS